MTKDKDKDFDDVESEKQVVVDAAGAANKPRRVQPSAHHTYCRRRLFQPSNPPPVPESIDDAKEIPLATASWLSRLLLTWMDPLLSIGFKRPLESADLWKMDHSRQAEVVSDRLLANIAKRQAARKLYNEQLATAKPSAWRRARWAAKATYRQQLGSEYAAYGTDSTYAARIATLEAEWRQKSGKRGGGNALARALLDTFPALWYAAPFKVISDAITITTPLLTKEIIRFSQHEYAYRHSVPGALQPNMGRGIGMAIGLFVLYLVESVFQSQFFFLAQHEGALARAAMIQAIYKTAFNHSVSSRAKNTTGKLMAHLSADISRIDMVAVQFHMIWIAPISLIVALILLCLQIGASGIIGFLVILVLAPLQAWLTKWGLDLRRKSMVFTESRSKLLQELLSSMSTIKMFTYEIPFLSRLNGIRASEMLSLRNMLFLRSAGDSMMFALPTIGSVFAFIMYSALNPTMDIANLFTAVTYFGAIQQPLGQIPRVLASFADVINALERVSGVFDAESREEGKTIDPDLDVAVRVKDATFQWVEVPTEDDAATSKKSKKDKKNDKSNKSSAVPSAAPTPERTPTPTPTPPPADPFSVRDLNLDIPRGQLIGIIGAVGSGKSSILQGLLGEMKTLSGTVAFGGRIGYCQQSAWIQNATIRDNILFGQPWDEAKYWSVIARASLTRDLEILADGDLTEIGEKGINISGGQKQRINIARALYFEADIVLLDDPLSALDAHVGRAVFNDAILGLRKAGKTVLLVTHGLHFLPQVDYVYTVDDGRITQQGTYAELMASGDGAFKELMDAFGGGHGEFDREADEEEAIEDEGKVVDSDDETAAGERKSAALERKGAGEGKGKLTTDEERVTGAVGPKVYGAYLSAGGLHWIPLVILMAVLMQGSQLMSTVWLTYWQTDSFHRKQPFYQGIYAMLGISSAFFTLFTGMSVTTISVTASRRLFGKALHHVFFSPMSFFDTTPLGRIMGIFTKDVDAMDNIVPDTFRYTLITICMLVGSIVIIAIHFPYFIGVVAGVMILYGFVVFFYRRSAREIKRLDSMHRSILYSHFSESLTGLATIRAYGETERFLNHNAELIDLQDRAYILTKAAEAWLEARLGIAGSLLILAVALMCTAGGGSISPGQVALTLNYMVQTTIILGVLLHIGTMLENAMNAVERTLYYSDGHLPQEKAYELDTDPKDWPPNGAISLDKVVMSYRPGQPIVLKGVSVDITAGERVGIVGRTGAGKTSITVALYRIAELLSGTISIDGLDISTLGLKKLRSSLAVIPQDPVLFSGTVRTNLDPFENYPDNKLYEALQRAGLLKPGGEQQQRFTLDSTIDDGGANLSIGQRSLVSLARAIVKDSKIMVLDEATAAVDLETDAEIQRAIREECRRSSKTLLCIAHRLRTIIGWDKILVMDAGEVVDFASPLELFEKEDSVFRSMCDQSRIDREEIVRAKADNDVGAKSL
ncbi:hypothetical protein VHUM_00599 [Vanrija humicola]|uniref:Uncharacterized protein n=1 Tax=Vanrija humicola TaxID=5417 RepID=A0A7D8V6H5_VANHU|nr:hypothetical protein VHUM_00599 [Vanrija humicola]